MADFAVDPETLKPCVDAKDWVEEAQLFGKMFAWAQIGNEESGTFVYLLSQKWVEAWKHKVSFSVIEEGMNLEPEQIRMDIELPVLNEDLVDHQFQDKTDEYEFLKTKDSNYSLFNVVARADIAENIDYHLIRQEAWQMLKAKHPEAKEIRRIKFTDPETFFTRVEVKFPIVLFCDQDPSLLCASFELPSGKLARQVLSSPVQVPSLEAHERGRAQDSPS